MNDCIRVKEFLLLAADDELEPEQTVWLESHLEGCADCRLDQLRFRRIDGELQTYRELLWRPGRPRTMRWVAAASGALAASVLAAFLVGDMPSAHTPRVNARLPQTMPAPTRPGLEDGAFVAIPYTVPLAPYERFAILKTEVPVTALIAAGFDVNPTDTAATLKAEVLVGQDGRAHAIRLVRN